MATWLRVEEGGGEPPRPDAFVPDPDLVLTRPFEVVAWGTVDGIPWQIDASVIGPGPEAKWWEHGPIGPELQFTLGRDGEFGGGGVGTHLNEGTHMTASIGLFGSQPRVVSCVGVVSNRVDRLEIRLDDGDVRTMEPRELAGGLPRVFWFFPPRGAAGSIVALAANGSVLQTERLRDVDVPADANSGTSVNPFGYRQDSPPPGWPPDETEYGPGEGPRHAEDFHLHEVTFPLYTISPDRWGGYVGLSGSSASGRDVTEVRFGYFDEPGGSRRGMEIVNAWLGHRPWDSLIRGENVGVWSVDPFPGDDSVDFSGRFLSREQDAAMRDSRGFPVVGPTRVAASDDVDVGRLRVEAYRREFLSLPLLRCIGLELPDSRVLVQGWDLSFEKLEGFARALERLELGNALFLSLKAAQAKSNRRFDELHGSHHGDG